MSKTDNEKEIEAQNDNAYDEPEDEKKGFRINIHVILIAAIVLVLGISVFELIQWNRGERITLDPNEDTSMFDIEVLDELIPMAPDDYAGHDFDDETTVLLLGNGDLSFSRVEDRGLDKMIADAAGVTVYNASFPYPTLATRNLAMIEKNYPDDIYSLTYLTDAI